MVIAQAVVNYVLETGEKPVLDERLGRVLAGDNRFKFTVLDDSAANVQAFGMDAYGKRFVLEYEGNSIVVRDSQGSVNVRLKLMENQEMSSGNSRDSGCRVPCINNENEQ